MFYGCTTTAKMPPAKKFRFQILIAILLAGQISGRSESTSTRVAPALRTGAATNYWAFKPPVRPPIPSVKHKDWPRTPIDYFILASLEEKGLPPAPMANKTTLLRRVTFDLHGLPPTPAELDAFVADKSPNAFARAVDRLLASPHYGERWGRHWLDVARFAESHGFEYDKIRENAWRYRDYVVQSFNEDKPYFQFVKEQIAGDALLPASREGIVATGFLVAAPYDEAGNTSASALLKARIREEELEEMIGAVSQTFLGLTVNCARCHDHKFDPIPQRDYYRLKAALDGVRHGERSLALAAEATARSSPAAAETPKAYAANSRQPGPTFVLARGDVEKKLEPVTAAGLSAFSTLTADFGLNADAPEQERRVKLADWIANAANPLTARVMVNRVWHYHFGRGIVGTPNDFGVNGERPSHPELLDYLASEFVAQGGSIKKLHRLILLSSTYQQSGDTTAKARHQPSPAELDADNQLLWHFPLRRLEAEAIRDAVLSVSGQINLQTGGASYRPFTVFVSNSHFYNLTDPVGPEFNRRTIYRMTVHSGRDPLLDSLDCPDPSTKTPVRSFTTTPIQALGLMNDGFIQREAKAFAERLARDAGQSTKAQIQRAWRLSLSRPPRKDETTRAAALAQEHGMESVCLVLLNSSEFLYVR